MQKLTTYLLLLGLLVNGSVTGQGKVLHKNLIWSDIQTLEWNGQKIESLYFNDAVNIDEFGLLPVFSETFYSIDNGLTYDIRLNDFVFQPFGDQYIFDRIDDTGLIRNEINFTIVDTYVNGVSCQKLTLLPLRYNVMTGVFEKLVSFDICLVPIKRSVEKSSSAAKDRVENSVLSKGDWYKIAVVKTGIYKITYDHLKNSGMDIDALNPENLQIYGNGGKMLPERNSDPRYDDLQENAIMVKDGNDGSFDQEDYILFYGQAPLIWEYVSSKSAFRHINHNYCDTSFYFITAGEVPGKRIKTISQSQHPPTKTVTTFTDFGVHENNDKNLIKSGKEWYGEEFSDVLEYAFLFDFPNLNTNSLQYFYGDFAARASETSIFEIYINGDSATSVTIPAVNLTSPTHFANPANKTIDFYSTTNELEVKVKYLRPNTVSTGWLNYIEINAVRNLVFQGGQFPFRDITNIAEGAVTEFQINQGHEDLVIWEVTNILDPKIIEVPVPSEPYKFTIDTETLREFVAFDNTGFYSPVSLEKIENQNLHAFGVYDYVIISPDDFIEQAERLKAAHEAIDNMEVCLITPGKIYNEFSSGLKDPTAIRDFVKMLYDKSGTPPRLKYLLLIGDGSYDPKHRLENNRDFIPAYQSTQSLKPTSSFITDDYYGLFDPNEGTDASGDVDIGIGRLPVNTPEEAETVVDKIIHYMSNSINVQGNWRNRFCFVADDEDYNLHFYQADTVLAKMVARDNKTININKIYLDAFKQENTSGGSLYPEANQALNKQIGDGALFVNYTGHGGELGWSAERILQLADINSWTNADKLPVFITATCEFSRFDNPALTSAGELVLQHPSGGGIALFTTTRLAFSGVNLTLNKRIYDTLFRANPGNYPRLGDLIKFSKNPSNNNTKNFHLLGDPALSISFPKYQIITDSVNGYPVDAVPDTLFATSKVTVSGYVSDIADPAIRINNFNGVINPVLYDKFATLTTLGNDPKSTPAPFQIQNRVLYDGSVSVVNGRFSFSFIIPRDISYVYGPGKLSYYGTDSISDAAGYYDDIIIGGFDEHATSDHRGPFINMYLNDVSFTDNTILGPNPVLYANLNDPDGINANSSGIGHDIVAIIDGNTSSSIILNEYFEPDMDSYQSGDLTFPFINLSEGSHTIELKAWDLFNNSSSETIHFIVADSIAVDLVQVTNFPNPFSNSTSFTFRHNQFEGDLTLQIEVFNMSGQRVATIGPQPVTKNGYTIEPVRWDGTGVNGAKLSPGFYFYKLLVKNELGLQALRIQKMIISN